MQLLTTLLISIIVTIAVMPYARHLAGRLQAIDRPGGRKIHEGIMPKCGGMAMALGASVPIMLWAPKTNFIKGLLIGSLIIVLFGLADDIKDLKPTTKLLGQVMAALVITLVSGVMINDLGAFLPAGILLPDWLAMPLTIFVIVGVTNATNLSDGLDGLAGGIALLVFICIGYLGVVQRDWSVVMVAIAVGGSVLGFLRFNSYPAQLFMGDAGSQFLGFAAIVLSIKLVQQSPHLSAILPLIILGVPVLDTLTVMIRRLAEGRSPFSADRNHFHHQLMMIGLYHTEAVLTIYLAQALLVLCAIFLRGVNDWILLSIYLLFSGVVLGLFHAFHLRGYRIDRERFLNRTKRKLKPLKDRGHIIKISFGIVKVGLPTLLIFNALLPLPHDQEPFFIKGGFLILLFLAWTLNHEVLNRIAKIALYLFTPFMIFDCEQSIYAYNSIAAVYVYNFLYVLLLASVFVTMKFTRRMNGFKSSTLDFLVVFVIILIPNLPNYAVEGYVLGMVAVKTVIMFYSFEVLIGESRREIVNYKITAAVLAMILGLEGLMIML